MKLRRNAHSWLTASATKRPARFSISSGTARATMKTYAVVDTVARERREGALRTLGDEVGGARRWSVTKQLPRAARGRRRRGRCQLVARGVHLLAGWATGVLNLEKIWKNQEWWWPDGKTVAWPGLAWMTNARNDLIWMCDWNYLIWMIAQSSAIACSTKRLKTLDLVQQRPELDSSGCIRKIRARGSDLNNDQPKRMSSREAICS